MVWSVSGDGLRFAFQLDYCSFVAYKLWQDVSHGEEEEEAEEVQRGRSVKGHGQSTNRRASRGTRSAPHQGKEDRQTQTDAAKDAGIRMTYTAAGTEPLLQLH